MFNVDMKKGFVIIIQEKTCLLILEYSNAYNVIIANVCSGGKDFIKFYTE